MYDRELWCQVTPSASGWFSTLSPSVQPEWPKMSPLCPPSLPWMVALCGMAPSGSAVAVRGHAAASAVRPAARAMGERRPGRGAKDSHGRDLSLDTKQSAGRLL